MPSCIASRTICAPCRRWCSPARPPPDRQLAQVEAGEAFLLRAATAPRASRSFSTDNIRDTFRLILQMAVVLTFAGRKPW